MKKTVTFLAGTGALLLATSGFAQDIPAPGTEQAGSAQVPEAIQVEDIPPSQAEGPTQTPSTQSPSAEASAFTDGQVMAFASAAMQMRELHADTSLEDADKQARAEAIVSEAGIDAETYSAIGMAARDDAELAQRIQLAVQANSQEPSS
ncbi:MAG: hypothetical protein P1U62_10850 [Alteraurantiacibacter sp. bin_em_oilr2.035]|nr:hypothetical protein [Alteraurantiacibacter sp. bin_em_oilr2.035]